VCPPTDLSMSPPTRVYSRVVRQVSRVFVIEFVNSVHKLKTGALAHALPSLWILDSINRKSFSGTATSAI